MAYQAAGGAEAGRRLDELNGKLSHVRAGRCGLGFYIAQSLVRLHKAGGRLGAMELNGAKTKLSHFNPISFC